MRVKTLLYFLTMILVMFAFTGCDDVPQQEIDDANAALDAAKKAEADMYVPDKYNAAKQALDNGMNLQLLFKQLLDARKSVTMPLILMGYWNTVFKFGVNAFLEQCQKVGIDGVILPDLPLEEYEEDYKSKFEAAGVHNILLVTPQTTDKRLAKIKKAASGFLYMVSTAATTGGALQVSKEREAYFQKVSQLDIPSLIGFGIHDKASFQHASQFANGAIIGTAFIKALEQGNAADFIDALF